MPHLSMFMLRRASHATAREAMKEYCHYIHGYDVLQTNKNWTDLSCHHCTGAFAGNEQHMNVLKHFVYVQYGCGKQFEVAVSLNHDVMTSFQHYCMPMDSTSMCSNTLYTSNMDAGSSLRWLSASTMT